MASKNFYVHNGLTVGDLTIDAASGDINTTGTITATNITINGSTVLTTASISSNIKTIDGNSIVGSGNYSVLPTVADATGDIQGIVTRTDSQISFNEGTRTYTIAPVSSSWSFYYKGTLSTISTSKSIVIADTSGGRFIYVNTATLDLVEGGSIPDFTANIYTSYIYWNSSTQKCIILGDERHGSKRDTTWHSAQHLNVGTVWRSGGGLTYTLNSSTNVSFAVGTPLVIADEDLVHTITHSASPSADYQQILNTAASVEVLYLSGTAYAATTATTTPWIAGTSLARYNLITGGSGSLVDANEGDYITYWLLATNDVRRPVKLVLGRNTYSTLDAAYAEDFTEYGLSFAEQVFMYQIVVQTSSAYTGNAAKIQIAGVRKITAKLGSGIVAVSASAHNALTGRDAPDSHSISAITNLQSSLDAKQATLVSGSNIKTVNGVSIVGSGNAELITSTATIFTFSSVTTSSSTTTGAVVIAGGLGIGQNVNVGGSITVSTSSFINGSQILTEADLVAITTTATYITNDPTSQTGLATIANTTTVYGTYNFGDVSSIATFGDYNTATNVGFYSINDASGSPGYIVYIGFTGITKFNRLVANVNYTQSSGHTVYVDLYNYSLSQWDTFTTYSGLAGWFQFALGLINDTEYISSGKVTARFYHISPGNTAHRTWIDYVALEQSITGGQGPRGATGATGATGPQGLTTSTTATTFNFFSTLGSTSTNTGAIVVAGGVGIGENLYVGGTIVGTATTATSAATAFSTIGVHTAGAGLTGSNFNGSTNQTWTLNTATLMTSAVTATSAAVAFSLANTSTTFVGRAAVADLATTSTNAAVAFSLANTSTTFVGRAAVADLATTSTNAATAFSTIGVHTAGAGLTGSNFNGSTNQTWTLNTATLMATAVTATSAAVAFSLANTSTTFVGRAAVADLATTATSAAVAFSLANTSTTFVGRAAVADLATTATSAATAFSTIGIHTAGTGLTGSNFNGSANQTWTLNTATLMASAVTSTNAAVAYSLANTATTFVGKAAVADLATVSTNISGGAAGSIPIQSASGTTAFIPIGAANFVLQSNGTTATWVSTSSLGISGGGGTTFTGGTVPNAVNITSSTQSSSTTTGALTVVGGVGIGGNLNVEGTVVGGGVRTTSSTTAPTNPTVGDIWYDTVNDVIYRFTNDGTTNYWIDVTGPTVTSSVAQYATLTGVETLTNKRVTLRVNNNGATTSGTITPTGDSSDQYEILGLTGGITMAAPSGTPTAGQKLLFRIKDNGTSRTITWTTSSGAYRAIGVTLTTATTASKNLYIGCVYNASDTFWDVIAQSQEA